MDAFCMDGRHHCGVSAIRELSHGERLGRRRNNRDIVLFSNLEASKKFCMFWKHKDDVKDVLRAIQDLVDKRECFLGWSSNRIA